ncbi:MAG: hypothetical protein EYC62_04195 [Alphaproteobacteria bacterium]|nr:MAG: hypothetical protein EYC62_04195 [Alphaproteobacteria bacterium]
MSVAAIRKTDPDFSAPNYSLMKDGVPFPSRPCFNWLPQYRYGLFVYKALQQACAGLLSYQGDKIDFAKSGTRGAGDVPLHLVRPVLMDWVIRQGNYSGYVLNAAESALQPFTNGELYYPLTADLALIVAKQEGSNALLNNVLPYMTPAPQTVEALAAVGGGYYGATPAEIAAAHIARKTATEKFNSKLRGMYGVQNPDSLRTHSAAVGGLIDACTRYLHATKPGFRTCMMVPEYWDLLRCVLTYSAKGLRAVEGLADGKFPEKEWLTAISQPDVDFAYISYTNNPLGRPTPHASIIKAIDAISDDALFFIDCTSIDIKESSNEAVVSDILKKFPHKNLLIAKSFSKEYNKGHIRLGYGLFTRPDFANALWPYMAGYPSVANIAEGLECLDQGNAHVLGAYRDISRQLAEFAKTRPHIRVSGMESNYTTLFFESEDACSKARGLIEAEFGSKVFPGELPMQGGGDMGLGQGEINLTSIKRIPFLPANGLRILMTTETVANLSKVL